MKKNLSIAYVSIALLLFGGYAYTHWHTARPVDTMTMVSVADENEYATVTGTYPQFANATAAFNAQISQVIEAARVAHLADSAENYKARYETATPDEQVARVPDAGARYPMSVDTKIVRNDTKVISLVVSIDEYAGGAHGQHTILTFNYDVVAGKPITIADLAQGDARFLEKLSLKSRALLLPQLALAGNMEQSEVHQGMLNDGTEPFEENFSVFTIPNDTQVTFYFDEYQVAAYVFGPQQITVDLPLQ